MLLAGDARVLVHLSARRVRGCHCSRACHGPDVHICVIWAAMPLLSTFLVPHHQHVVAPCRYSVMSVLRARRYKPARTEPTRSTFKQYHCFNSTHQANHPWHVAVRHTHAKPIFAPIWVELSAQHMTSSAFQRQCTVITPGILLPVTIAQ